MKPIRAVRRTTKPKRPRARKPPERPAPRLELPDAVRWLGRYVAGFYP